MSDVVLKVENVSKQYRLGEIGTGTISHDLNRWWSRLRGKEDPFMKIAETNDRTQKGTSEYVWALKDVNFEVKKGEVLGIIGKNGAGKSTLLKILSQVTTPTIGEIKIKGRIASLLEVGTGFHPELSGRENIFLNGAILGMTKSEIKSKFDEIVAFSGVERYIDTPVKRYSSGMYVRLAFAVAAHLEPEILVVDEVLAVGDSEFQEKCLGKMKDVSEGGRTVLFVSHSMASIKALCTKAIFMNKGRLHSIGETNNIISNYKFENESMEFSGVNDNPQSSYKTEVGKITSIKIRNQNSHTSGELMFEEEIGIEINIYLNNIVNNVNIDFRILSSDGIIITHVSTLYDEKKLNLNKGENKIFFKVENRLHPGVYMIEAGIHYPNNSTIDYTLLI